MKLIFYTCITLVCRCWYIFIQIWLNLQSLTSAKFYTQSKNKIKDILKKTKGVQCTCTMTFRCHVLETDWANHASRRSKSSSNPSPGTCIAYFIQAPEKQHGTRGRLLVSFSRVCTQHCVPDFPSASWSVFAISGKLQDRRKSRWVEQVGQRFDRNTLITVN